MFLPEEWLLRPQIPWVAAGTVRDNVLFGQPWDEKKYRQVRCRACCSLRRGKAARQGDAMRSRCRRCMWCGAQVLRACALEPDVAGLPAGDQTELGERGINVSR